MSFWDALVNIGGDIAGSFIGDPLLGQQIAGVGKVIGGATQATGQNRVTGDQQQLSRDSLALQGAQDYQTNLLRRAALEEEQRSQGQRDLLRTNYLTHPHPTNLPPMSSELAQELTKRTSAPLQYDATTMPALKPFTPTPAAQPSFWEKLGTGLSLGAGLLGSVSGLRGDRGSFGTPGGVTGNFNPDDFLGIDPETGMPFAGLG